MRKYIALITALALMSIGLNAQTGRASGLSGKGLDGFIEQTQFDSLHVDAGTFVYGIAGSGQEVTATGVELNYLDITTLGTGAVSKAVVLSATGAYTWPSSDTLFYSVLNDQTTTLTTSALKLNYLDIATLGTQEASKVVTTDSNSNSGISQVTQLWIGPSNTEVRVTSTPDELNYLDLVALGTGAPSKAVVLDANGSYTWLAGDTLFYAELDDGTTTVTSTALEINVLDGIAATLTYDELDYLDIATLGTQEASKVVTTDAQVNSGVSKVTQLWIGGSGAETRVLSSAAELDMRALTVKMIDVSSAGQVHVVSPYAGEVTAVYSVLNATIATAPAGITIKDKDGNVMGTITIADGGSGPGDVDSDVSIANADVAVGDMIEIETDNASTNTVEVEFTILIAIL